MPLAFDVLRARLHSEQRALGRIDVVMMPPQHRPHGIAVALNLVCKVFEVGAFMDAGMQIMDMAEIEQVVGDKLVVALDMRIPLA